VSEDIKRQSAILAKAVSLIEKTTTKIRRIDTTLFPTSSTNIVQSLLIEALNQLGSKEVLASVNSEVLFERLN